MPAERQGKKAVQRRAGRAQLQRCMVLVILDELDRLIVQDPALLYELFLLPQVCSSIHCTDKQSCLHPELYLQPGCKPDDLAASETLGVLVSRLRLGLKLKRQ